MAREVPRRSEKGVEKTNRPGYCCVSHTLTKSWIFRYSRNGKAPRASRSASKPAWHVNDQPVNDLANNPFGGEKNSGIGRFGGDWAVEAFMSDKWLTVQHFPRRYPASAEVLKGPWAGG